MTARSAEEAIRQVATLRQLYTGRDSRYGQVSAVRRGDYEHVAPGMFPDDLPAEIVANAVDAYARDMAEAMAKLPGFNCTSSNMRSDAARERSDRRTKIVANYLSNSRLGTQMYSGADHFSTFAFVAAYIEPDLKARQPRITIENSVGGYPEFNRWGEVVSYSKVYDKTVGELVSMFPEKAAQIRGDDPANRRGDGGRLELVRYCDAENVIIFLPRSGWTGDAVLTSYPHRVGECPVKIALRPQWDEEMRGSWDSAIWVQIARARMAQLAWEAGEKAVTAPIVATPDMQDFSYGADSILYTANPEKVRRLPIEIPQSAFAEMASLREEMRLATRYPEGRTGNLSASVVTGRGVQELNAGFNTQIQAAQDLFTTWFSDVVRVCFRLDEAYWPDEKKTIRGSMQDAPYEVSYTPSKDIDGEYACDVQYGMAAGMDPNRATVMLLQLRGDDAISRDFMLRQMPFAINVTDEMSKIEVEKTRDALLAGLGGLGASIPEMAAQGQDPVDAIMKLSKIIELRQQGKSLEDAVKAAFEPPKPPPAAEGGDPTGAALAGPGQEAAVPPPGLPTGPAGPAGGGAPQAPPDIATALATLTGGGDANMRVGTQRNRTI